MKTRRDGEVLQQVQHIVRAVATRYGLRGVIGSFFDGPVAKEHSVVALLNSSLDRVVLTTKHDSTHIIRERRVSFRIHPKLLVEPTNEN